MMLKVLIFIVTSSQIKLHLNGIDISMYMLKNDIGTIGN